MFALFHAKKSLPSPVFFNCPTDVGFETSSPNACVYCGLCFNSSYEKGLHLNPPTGTQAYHISSSQDLPRDNSFTKTLSDSIEAIPSENNSNLATGQYFCKVCNRAFETFKGYKQHQGKMHRTKRRNFKCLKCSRKFVSKYALKFHKIQVHEKAFKVECEHCSKVLYNKYHYQVHLKSCF
ncbi:unnamed protein product [Blepharisma stoltei]|uniref:C2H2-type domain-containing protein n=1 Tax=Blepharisma stoltei TaxID=1481888 RepID=A0AAU9J010_9CILI|nr:unnamed protein product [Blepharisma stoltei]